MRHPGYRPLQTGCLYRPYRRPLFGAPARTPRALRLMVWADDAPRPGERLALDVFMADGSTLPTIADVAWVDAQPPGGWARYRVGLEVAPASEAGLRALEQLVAEVDLRPSPAAEERPHQQRGDAARVVVEVRGGDAEGRGAARGGDEAAAEDVPG